MAVFAVSLPRTPAVAPRRRFRLPPLLVLPIEVRVFPGALSTLCYLHSPQLSLCALRLCCKGEKMNIRAAPVLFVPQPGINNEDWTYGMFAC